MTPERVRELFDYDADTGALLWKKLPRRGRRVAGSRRVDGYWQVFADGRNHAAHRIVWMHVHGVQPRGVIDHINGDRADNRVCNLRDVSIKANNQNVRRPFKTSSTGLLGVGFLYGKHVARISVDGRPTTIGRFNSPEEASEAYLKKKREVHEGCTL